MGQFLSRGKANSKGDLANEDCSDDVLYLLKPGQSQVVSSYEAVAESPFFKLPPEIRTIIYRYSLVQARPAKITKRSGIPEPGLLSKIIRFEAASIFYLENTHETNISNSEPAMYVVLHRKLTAIHGSRKWTVRHRPYGKNIRNWPNLRKWLILHRKHKAIEVFRTFRSPPEAAITKSMFDMAKLTRSESSDAKFEKLVDSMRPSLVAMNAEWAMD